MSTSGRLSAFVITVMVAASAAHAGTFVNNFDMDGNYTQYLYSTSNVQVWNETPSFPDVYYWAPTTNGVTGTVVYRYQFSTPITSASVFASVITATGYDPTSTALLDVSPDGTNWTNIGSATTNAGGSSTSPIDISSYVDGSDYAYIRADLYESVNYGNIHYSQFLRTGNPTSTSAPNVYQFEATTAVPEPPSFTVLSILGFGLLGRRYRQALTGGRRRSRAGR